MIDIIANEGLDRVRRIGFNNNNITTQKEFDSCEDAYTYFVDRLRGLASLELND